MSVDSSNHAPEYSPAELFEIACGIAEPRRAALAARQAECDPELLAEIAFFSCFVPTEDRFRNPTAVLLSRVTALCFGWGVLFGIFDSHALRVFPEAVLKPWLVGAIAAIVGPLLVLLVHRHRASWLGRQEGTFWESVELPLLVAGPGGLLFAVICTYGGAERFSPLGYWGLGFAASLFGATRGAGLRSALAGAAAGGSRKAIIGRGLFYFFYLGANFVVFAIVFGVIPAYSDLFDFPLGLRPQFLWSALTASFVANISIAVRLALDEKHQLRLDAAGMRPVLLREGIAALVTGPFLLAIFLAVTGNYHRPVLFSTIAAGFTLWFMAGMIGSDAVFGTTTTMATLFRDTTIVVVRRGIRLGLALVGGYMWRVLLLEPLGFEAIETLWGLLAYAVLLHGIEKLPLPVETWLFSLQRAATSTMGQSLHAPLRLFASYAATLVDEAMKGPFDPLGMLYDRAISDSAAHR